MYDQEVIDTEVVIGEVEVIQEPTDRELLERICKIVETIATEQQKRNNNLELALDVASYLIPVAKLPPQMALAVIKVVSKSGAGTVCKVARGTFNLLTLNFLRKKGGN